MTPKFHGKVIAGKLNLFKDEARLFKDCLASLEGKEVEISVGKRKHSRTEQQMRYYWSVVVKLIANYTGEDIDLIHEFLKDKFAPKKVITVKDEARTVPGCTHDLFKDNFFEDYVDHIRRWAAQELQISIPDPNQVSV